MKKFATTALLLTAFVLPVTLFGLLITRPDFSALHRVPDYCRAATLAVPGSSTLPIFAPLPFRNN